MKKQFLLSKFVIGFFIIVLLSGILSGCQQADKKIIIRIAHVQSASHPDHIALLEFKAYIEEHLGEKYEVQIFPNEILGTSQKAIELVQTGALDFAVASAANLETFANIYQIFSIPYLFDSEEHFFKTMQDEELMNGIFESTEQSGFQVVTWFTAGVRNFYSQKEIRTPADLKGMKIRVQQSPTNVRMMELFGAAATPMSFGEVYTAIQQGVIDGAENNEFALTNNKHGEVAKFYTYNMHQMVPDMLIANVKFLKNLSEEERNIFYEAARICTETEVTEWEKQIEETKETARNMGVTFLETDISAFREKVLPLHDEILSENPKLKSIYNRIQENRLGTENRKREEQTFDSQLETDKGLKGGSYDYSFNKTEGRLS